MANAFTVQTLCGAELRPYIPELARLRITVFREYPYLYDGDEAYERHYLQRYLDCPQSAIFLIRPAGDETVVGATTSLPLSAEMPAITAPFRERGLRLDKYFYLGESVLLPACRGQGLGHRFFELREAAARAVGAAYTTFCAVDRPTDHPRRPADYRSLETFWERRGYQRRPELHAELSWKELDEHAESPKRLTFWIHALR